MGGKYAKRKTRLDGTGNDYYKQRVFVLTTLGNPVQSGLVNHPQQKCCCVFGDKWRKEH